MAEPFKTFINADVVTRAAGHLARHDPGFDGHAFCAAVVPQLAALELKARAMCIADALEQYLAADFHDAAAHLERALRPLEAPPGTGGLDGWFLWGAGEFVARRGMAQPVRALSCLREMTQRFTAEFAIRPLIAQHPTLVFDTLRQWVHDDSEHVRRLVSEGTRPRLPWGLQLRDLIADPSPSLPLLAALQDDASEYVRRSVANHLNDIAKDHPLVVAAWLERHLPDATPHRRALLRHASRTLVKQGYPPVLAVWGRAEPLHGTATLELAPAHITLGDDVGLTITLRSQAKGPQALTVDYVVHHVKANGQTSAKVFKGWETRLEAGQSLTLRKRHAVRPITTRRYYAGAHRVVVQVNGQPVAEGVFHLTIGPSAAPQ
jgi:3-methyladenine DNA glycosylase AlkC